MVLGRSLFSVFLDFSSTHSITIYTAAFWPPFGIRQIAIAMGGVYDIWLFDMIIFNISIWLLEVQATDRYPSFCHRLLRIIRKYRCFEIWWFPWFSAVCYGWRSFGRPSEQPLEGWASWLARGRFPLEKGWAGRAGVGLTRAFISPCKGWAS